MSSETPEEEKSKGALLNALSPLSKSFDAESSVFFTFRDSNARLQVTRVFTSIPKVVHLPYARRGFTGNFWLPTVDGTILVRRRFGHNHGQFIGHGKDFAFIFSSSALVSLEVFLRRHLASVLEKNRRSKRAFSSSVRPNDQILSQYLILSRSNSVTNYIGYGDYVAYSRVWSGTRTPNFHELKRKKLALPINNHSVNIFSKLDAGEYNRERFYVDGVLVTDSVNIDRFRHIGFDPQQPAHLPQAYERALKRLIEQTGSLNANLAQDLAQISQTVRTVTDSASRIARSVIALKKGNFSSAVDALWRGTHRVPRVERRPTNADALANNMLALQYGWKPLLMDVHGAAESLARYNLAGDHVVVARSSATQKDLRVDDLWTNETNPTKIGRVEFETSTRCIIGLRYTIGNALRTFLAQTGFTNPVNLAWEVLPFSFVFDWFLPLGPYLETLSAWDGLSFVDGYLVNFTRENIKGEIRSKLA